MRPKYLVAILVLLALAVPAAPAHAGGIVSVCDEPPLLAALAGGGTVTFSCSGTIHLDSLILISADTTIDGSGQTVTISGNNAVRVFKVNSGVTLNLNELTVANGSASSGGGGIWNVGGTLTVTNSTFSSNSAYNGGGIYNNGGTLTVSNSTFSGNSAGGDPYGYGGGGIYSQGGVVTVSNSTFAGNSATGGGGGIYLVGGRVTVSNSTFAGNSATYTGGGIKNGGSSTLLTVSNSTFSGNSATHGGGGGINWQGGALTVSNSTFSSNSVPGWGGGIRNESGTLDVSNSTFAGNSATGGGGGIRNYNGAVTLKNTIVVNSPTGDNCGGTITDGGGNLSYPDTTCPGINSNPLLSPLQTNGGPTHTMALGPGSAALDAGNDAICAAAPVNNLDQRGIARPHGPHCDIGAFEATLQPMTRRSFLPIIMK